MKSAVMSICAFLCSCSILLSFPACVVLLSGSFVYSTLPEKNKISCHTHKRKRKYLSNKLYNLFSGNSSDQCDTDKGAWRGFFVPVEQLWHSAEDQALPLFVVMRLLEVEVEPQTELCVRDAEMLLKQTYIIKVLHIFLEHWFCAISFLTRKSV